MVRTSDAGAAASGAAAAPAIRPIVILSLAAFASSATLRVGDPLIPQLAAEFGTTPGAASLVTTAFTLSYGLSQILIGPLGERFGKYRVVAWATLFSGISAGAAAFAPSLAVLGVLRLASGATTGAIIPLSMAHIGDIVAYERRQPVIARFLAGQILGIIFGQVFGGLFGDWLGWRGVFVALALVYAATAVLLRIELRSQRLEKPDAAWSMSAGGMAARYLALFQNARVRIVVVTAFFEGFLFYGGFVYLGAYLRDGFGLSYALVGLLLAFFGVGGLLYAATVRRLLARLGERGLVLSGGILLALAFPAAAAVPTAALFILLGVVLGFGFYMLHNTLQTNATQMAPEARGLAIAAFAFAYFLGQAAGAWTCGKAVDAFGYGAVFPVCGGLLIALALAFRATLPKRGRAA